MPTYDLITFEDIYAAVFNQTKGDSTDPETFQKVLTSIQLHYRQVCSKKRWKFLRVTNRSFRLPGAVTTGLVNLVSNSKTIQGVGTSFSKAHRNWWILPNGQQTSYRVINVDPVTQTLILNTTFNGASTANSAYKLFMSEIPLWPDMDEVQEWRIEGKPWFIKPKGPAYINAMRQRCPTISGPPRIYSLEGIGWFQGPLLGQFILGFDFLGQGNVKCMSIFPHIPDIDYTCHIPYKKIVTPLVNPKDEPLIPPEHRIILYYLALSDWYAGNKDETQMNYYQNLGKDEMKAMMGKYIDTEDLMRLIPTPTRRRNTDWLTHHSGTYFDVEG